MSKLNGVLPRHERMALRSLYVSPDRIRLVESDEVLAACIVYCDLQKKGLVEIDNEDGMLVTINAAGRAAIEGND